MEARKEFFPLASSTEQKQENYSHMQIELEKHIVNR